MIKRIAAGLMAGVFALVLMGATVSAQEGPPVTPPAAAVESANKATGIELPPDQTVAPDEGFVNIAATCKGSVKWLVISSVKVKYVSNDSTNSIIVSVPTQPGTVVTVFAVGLVDGKMTEFVRTSIQVSGTPGPQPPGPQPPGPQPPGPQPPAPVAGKFHLTFVVDMNNATPELAALLNSAALRKTVSDKGGFMRIYDKTSPVVAAKKLDGLVAKNGGGPTMILQSQAGAVLNPTELLVPRTDADVIAILNKYVK